MRVDRQTDRHADSNTWRRHGLAIVAKAVATALVDALWQPVALAIALSAPPAAIILLYNRHLPFAK